MPARDAVEVIHGKDRKESGVIPKYLFCKFLERVHIGWIE
jgi:hypothetical protein